MKRAIAIVIVSAAAIALAGCVTPKDLQKAMDSYAGNYDKYLANIAAVADVSKVELECDSPCSLKLPGVPSASPDRPTSDAPSVSAAYQAQLTAGASVASTGLASYLALKEAREQGATSRYIAEQRRQEAEAREVTVQTSIDAQRDISLAQQEQLGELLDRLIPEEPEEPEPEPDPIEEEVIE